MWPCSMIVAHIVVNLAPFDLIKIQAVFVAYGGFVQRYNLHLASVYCSHLKI